MNSSFSGSGRVLSRRAILKGSLLAAGGLALNGLRPGVAWAQSNYICPLGCVGYSGQGGNSIWYYYAQSCPVSDGNTYGMTFPNQLTADQLGCNGGQCVPRLLYPPSKQAPGPPGQIIDQSHSPTKIHGMKGGLQNSGLKVLLPNDFRLTPQHPAATLFEPPTNYQLPISGGIRPVRIFVYQITHPLFTNSRWLAIGQEVQDSGGTAGLPYFDDYKRIAARYYQGYRANPNPAVAGSPGDLIIHILTRN